MTSSVRKIGLYATTFLICCIASSCANNGDHSKASPNDISNYTPEAKILALEYESTITGGKDIARSIGGMASADQFARWHIIEIMRDANLTSETKKQVTSFAGKYIDEIDEENTRKLKKILINTSWQNLSKMKPDVADNAWTIVQHSDDVDFQKEALIDIEPLVKQGILDGQRFANLKDRILKSEGEAQIFGTQTVCEDGVLQIYKMIEPERVNERRKTLGMVEVEEYANKLRELYGSCSEK